MLKIGMVGGAKAWHARSFSEMFNGYDEDLARKHNFPLYKTKLEGARVTHIWDPDRESAELIAKICGIENVVEDMEEMIGGIDGVIIADDTTMKHQRRAIPFLKAGLPTFVDKPLSPSIEEAEEIINLAREYKAPFMSCSALRYAKEVEEFLAKKEEIGEILTGNSICSGDLIFYGIHAMEQLYVCIGQGIKSVQNVGEEGKDIVIITKEDGRKFVLTVYKEISYLFQMNLYGTKGWREVRVEDSDYFYSNMLRAFLRMVETKEPPFPPEETLEIIKTLVLARQSAQKKGEIIYL
ncbi:Gfo/Idh/MocA family oxidoreductase [bacterium]|nr:Gfo/Idh/MocA family oxidoreductase [bacterium]